MGTRHVIGTVEDFPRGEGVAVTVENVEIAVFNTGEDIYALVDNCPHKNLPLSRIGDEKYESTRSVDAGSAADGDDDPKTLGNVDEDRCTINCPWHSLEWELDTGYSPVRQSSIRTFDVEVTDDGDVVLDV